VRLYLEKLFTKKRGGGGGGVTQDVGLQFKLQYHTHKKDT
jgi:hypothetical protein